MPLLVRKIDKRKWLQNDILRGEPVSADAITNCLKTKDNCLSLWRIPDRSRIDDAVLAQTTMFAHLDGIDVVILDEKTLEKRGISIENVPGDTKIAEMAEWHVHVTDLNVDTLAKLAQSIAESLQTKSEERYEKGRLARLLASAVSQDRLSLDELRENVRNRVAPVLANIN
jgi:hypothetical protein